MIITAVGVNSQSGKIFSLLQGETNIGSEPAKTGDGELISHLFSALNAKNNLESFLKSPLFKH